MRSLSLKITIALIAVSLLAVVIVGVAASLITEQEFSLFLGQHEQVGVADIYTMLYEEYGSWEDIPNQRIREVLQNNASGINMRMSAVADTSGTIVIGSMQHPVGTQMPKKDIRQGISIKVNGAVVGTVISNLPPGSPISDTVNEFTEGINQSLLYSGLIAVAVSIVLGIILSRTMTKQLKTLSKATDAIASGESIEPIPVKSKDEVGQLTASFNQMNAELAQSRSLRQQMTADIAHELRTPLSIIQGRAETLADGYLPPTQETFDIIHQESLRINRLVEDLRMLTLSDAGELHLEKMPTSIGKLLTDTKNAYSTQSAEKGILISVNCESNLPVVMADPDRIRQVLDNLVSNAFRYVSEGGKIAVSAKQGGNRVVVQVQDTGCGIAEEDLIHLFDRFYRGDKSRTREKGGSGLGLAIAKSLVNGHGGDISVDSKVGVGTTFTFLLPLL